MQKTTSHRLKSNVGIPLSARTKSLVESSLIKLSDRRQELVDKLFKDLVQNKENKFQGLLPALNTSRSNLRNTRKFKVRFQDEQIL